MVKGTVVLKISISEIIGEFIVDSCFLMLYSMELILVKKISHTMTIKVTMWEILNILQMTFRN